MSRFRRSRSSVSEHPFRRWAAAVATAAFGVGCFASSAPIDHPAQQLVWEATEMLLTGPLPSASGDAEEGWCAKLRGALVPKLDLSTMSLRAFGLQWERATPAQRRELSRLFTSPTTSSKAMPPCCSSTAARRSSTSRPGPAAARRTSSCARWRRAPGVVAVCERRAPLLGSRLTAGGHRRETRVLTSSLPGR
jgi:hypothetical protein